MKFSREYLQSNRDKVIKFLIFAVIFVVASFVFLVRTDEEGVITGDTGDGRQISSSAFDSEDVAETSLDIVICDVSGAVKDPKVVELKKGDRVADAIDAAGGLSSKADISNINRAAVVKDGEKILIPEAGGSPQDANSMQATSPTKNTDPNTDPVSGKININTADSAALQQISGVGPVTADKIIEYRTSNGVFTNIEDLKNISGIGEKTYEKLKDQVTL